MCRNFLQDELSWASEERASFRKYSPAWPSLQLTGGVDRRLSGEEGLVWDRSSDDDPVLRRALTERLFLCTGEKEPFDSRGDEGGEEAVVVSVELHFESGDTRLNTMMMEYTDDDPSGQWPWLLAESSCRVISSGVPRRCSLRSIRQGKLLILNPRLLVDRC